MRLSTPPLPSQGTPPIRRQGASCPGPHPPAASGLRQPDGGTGSLQRGKKASCPVPASVGPPHPVATAASPSPLPGLAERGATSRPRAKSANRQEGHEQRKCALSSRCAAWSKPPVRNTPPPRGGVRTRSSAAAAPFPCSAGVGLLRASPSPFLCLARKDRGVRRFSARVLAPAATPCACPMEPSRFPGRAPAPARPQQGRPHALAPGRARP